MTVHGRRSEERKDRILMPVIVVVVKMQCVCRKRQ